jgi:hypothetical protein
MPALSTLNIDLASPTSYDAINVTGTATLGGYLNLVADPVYVPAPGQAFTILTATSVSGTFVGLANGSVISSGSASFLINYTSTAVTLTSARRPSPISRPRSTQSRRRTPSSSSTLAFTPTTST